MLHLTRAERILLCAYALVGAVGGLFGYYALRDLDGVGLFVGPQVGDGYAVASSIGGAVVAASLLHSRFGGGGWRGAANACIAGFVANGLFAVIAGTLILPVFGTMFAPWLMLSAVFETFWLGPLWIFAFWAFHLARRAYDGEQAALYKWAEPVDAT